MSKEYKTSHKIYTAWNYEREIEDLNKASEEGWQLIKGGCFHSKFKKNENIQYRYQLDYPGTIEDMGRYIETFREQGWEYINSTFNGWHYFRKFYDPSLPEEEYEIFTDHSSLKEMNSHWTKLATILCILIGLSTILLGIGQLFHPTLPHIIQIIANLFILIIFARGILIMRNPEKKKSMRGDSYIFLALILFLIIGNGGTLFLNSIRPNFNSVYASDYTSSISDNLEEGIEWNIIDVNYKDNYYMDLTIDTKSPISFNIVDGENEIIYTVTDQSLKQSDIKLNLDKGLYRILLTNFKGGPINITIELD